MTSETDTIQRNDTRSRSLDRFDRKILSALVADAGQSYARLAEQVGLSAPAVHERVKRLRRDGVIAATAAQLNAKQIGKPLLAFVHVDTTGWGKTQSLMAIEQYPEVEEIHSVAGDTCMLLKVRARDTHDLESLLAILYDTPGVKSTRSYVVLSTYLERPVQAGVTGDWPAIQMPE